MGNEQLFNSRQEAKRAREVFGFADWSITPLFSAAPGVGYILYQGPNRKEVKRYVTKEMYSQAIVGKITYGAKYRYVKGECQRWENVAIQEGYPFWIEVMKLCDPKVNRTSMLKKLFGMPVDKCVDGDGRKVQCFLGEYETKSFTVWYAAGRGISLEVDRHLSKERVIEIVRELSKVLVEAMKT